VLINVLRDTGATQSLILENVLPFSDDSSAGVSVLLQGVEMRVISVPLHVIELQSDIISDTVAVGLRPSLTCRLYFNDLAGNKVMGNPQVSEVPCFTREREQVEYLFPSCAVTHAMSEAAMKAAQEESGNDEPPNGSMGNKTVDGKLVTPTSHDLQEANDPVQPSHDVQP